jgi:hypothetical protein
MQVHQRGEAVESIDSLLHRCDEIPEREETTRREETNPEVAAPDGDAGGGDNEVSDGDECVDDDDKEDSLIDLPDPVEEMSYPPDLCQYTAKAGALQQLTDNIRGQQQLKRGIRVSYPTTWRAYSKWHSSMYGVAPPACAQTGLMWVTRILGTQFLIHAAAHGMTANQVHPPDHPHPHHRPG